VLIIKATDKKNFGSNPGFDEIVDLNPRGLLILFSDGNDYRRVQENRRCFESEDVVPSPYILVSVKKGNLYISYSDKNNDVIYTFRHRNSEFELIGNDNGCDGCEGFSHDNKRSINFLTKKQLVKTCAKYKGYECIKFEETWSNITIKKPIRLRDFCSDDFYLDKYIDYKK
ncbi:MAG: hypothetical protein LBC59_03755, partial [Chitinispirillales bacterium]|nr:hypothetical protein [Chitinispirillales bacterium]